MTSYWDGWGTILSKIERNEKVDPQKFLYAVAHLISILHDFDHEHGDHGHTLDIMLRKDKMLEKLLLDLGSEEGMPEASRRKYDKT